MLVGQPNCCHGRDRPVTVAPVPDSSVEKQVAQVFSLVCEALAEATDALLAGEAGEASKVVAADESVDQLTGELSELIWGELARLAPANPELRRLVGLLLVLPELERSADLAEHIAQRAVGNVGTSMSPLSRGIVQRMAEVALEMWQTATTGFVRGAVCADELDQADEELDILSRRLTSEVAIAAMPAHVAAQVTLLGRFYERLGDHAVNLARRMELFF
jgi:phosphate transport system protein